MATPPKVQTIAQASAELNPAFAESRGVIKEQMSGLGAKYDAQRSAIYAERGQGFNAINNQATGRGGSFSGVPIDEQSTYLSTKFLPGLQQADYQQNDERLKMKGMLADLNKDQYMGALSRVDQQKSALNAWNLQQQQLEAQRREAEKQRKFQAQQSALDRQFQASQNAADRAATRAASSGGGGGTLSNPVSPFVDAFSTWMKGNKSMASRQQQDAYINSLFTQYGIGDTGSRQVVWDAINAQFKRSSDPTKDWTYRR